MFSVLHDVVKAPVIDEERHDRICLRRDGQSNLTNSGNGVCYVIADGWELNDRLALRVDGEEVARGAAIAEWVRVNLPASLTQARTIVGARRGGSRRGDNVWAAGSQACADEIIGAHTRPDG